MSRMHRQRPKRRSAKSSRRSANGSGCRPFRSITILLVGAGAPHRVAKTRDHRADLLLSSLTTGKELRVAALRGFLKTEIGRVRHSTRMANS